ncbi:Flagellar assembly factor FliW [Pseudobythopirellula maris]|uniref:Flagellar assembly factor FliW n=1 Tax=Pseudobythopirellula maris TaxID=2527991 RepID=A0A5C5ZMK4_9BACT|nr:flagellar assembly protein FliW [Pseudobythopirellula maris]TWT88217.1 Flagellar assembly factor FliW [Pseudobythopirellula maris]
MQVKTDRFGVVECKTQDLLEFPYGLIGMEGIRRWVLLADAQSPALAWLQAVDRSDVALAVVSPRRFVQGYKVRVADRDLDAIGLAGPQDAQVLVVVSRHAEGLSANLRAPIVVSLESRRGRQVVSKDEHPVRHLLGGPAPLRRTA